jgi:signal transduction histidine kinase
MDLRDLIGEVLADQSERDRIIVSLPDAPVVVNADPGRLEQVVSNLLDNAVKFSPHDAAIDVELAATTSASARLLIRDRGFGIPPEHREHIFERFHQAHAESHRSGIGLGLYIAKQIVDLHGGTIDIDSSVSDGTQVAVNLPLLESAPAPGTEAA